MTPDGVPLSWRPDRVAAVSQDDAEVWLFGGPGPVRLSGKGAGALARLVDGSRDARGLLDAAATAGMPLDAAEAALARWWAAGHLVIASPALPTAPRVAVRDRMTPGFDGSPALDLVAALRAGGVAAELVATPPAARPVTDAATTPADPGRTDTGDVAGPSLLVVLVDDLLTAVEESGSVPTVLVQLCGHRPLVSPVLHPLASCPACLVVRLRRRRSPELVAARRVGLVLPPPAAFVHDSCVPTVAGIVAAAATAVARARPAEGDDPMLTVPALGPYATHLAAVDPMTGVAALHRLVRVPGCGSCDPDGPTVLAAHLDGPPLTGQHRDRTEGAPRADGGGLRVVDPEETWNRYSHLVSDVVGVVPWVVPTGPTALRAFSAGINVAAEEDLALLRSRLRRASGGKGLSLSAARTGALTEALERHSLRGTGQEPTVRARFRDLEGALHPNEIDLFSERQLQRAAQWRALGLPVEEHGKNGVPMPFDVDEVHDWTAVSDIRTGAVRWMLSTLVWLSWPAVRPGQPRASSNGAAAGNTHSEALVQGLMELVERDSVALWWYPRCRRPAFDLATWDDPRIAAALSPQRALGTEAWVLDVTTDLGIPAAVAVATGVGPAPQAPLLGFGAHLDPVTAITRALTELAQMQAPFTELRPGDVDAVEGDAERRWLAEVTPESQPWLLPDGVADPVDSPAYQGLDEALEDAVARLARHGYDALWADCTRPDLGLPVVRTWAPGLRHFWSRFGPGRLYEVPPALGWRPGGYDEDDLNPYGMIL